MQRSRLLAITILLAVPTTTPAAESHASSCMLAIASVAGEPLASARVEQRQPNGNYLAVATATDGRIALALATARPVSLRIRAPGFAERRLERLTTCPRTIALRPAMMVAGLVRAPGGEPIADAVVSIDVARLRPRGLPPDADNDGALRDGKVETRTKADGRFVLGEIPRALGYELRVTHANQAPLSLALNDSAKDLKLRFAATGSITATVIGDDRKPIEGVQATARSSLELDRDEPLASASTGPDGLLKLEGLAAGNYRVEVLPPAGQRMIFDPVAVVAGGSKSLGILRPVAGLAIEGKVVDTTRTGLAKAKIRAYRKAGESSTLERVATSDNERKFRLGGLKPAPYELRVTPQPPYLVSTKNEVEPGATNVEIEVARGATISGVVSSSSGRLLCNLDVSAIEQIAAQWRPQVINGKVVDADTGAFTIEALPAGKWSVRASGPGHAAKISEPLEVGQGEQLDGLALVLDNGLTLRGSVVDQATKAGIAGAAVWERDRQANSTVTSSDGLFELDGVAAGVVQLRAQHVDFAAASASSVVSVDNDNRIVIELSRGASLEGSVRTGSGIGVAGVQLLVSNDGAGQSETALTKSDGTYRFEHLAAGNCEVQRSARTGAESVEKKIVKLVDGETARLDFVAGVAVYGVVTREGVPLSAIRIAIATSPKEVDFSVGVPYRFVSGWTGPDGSYRLEGLDFGPAKMKLEVDRQTSERLISIPEGGDYRFDVAFPGRLVTGSLIDKNTKRAVKGNVRASGVPSDLQYSYAIGLGNDNGLGESQMYSIGGGNQDTTKSDDAGRFSLWIERGLSVSLSAGAEGYKSLVHTLEPGDPDRNISVELVPEKAAEIFVELVGPDGSAVSGGWAKTIFTFPTQSDDRPSTSIMSTQFQGTQARLTHWVEEASTQLFVRSPGLTAASRMLDGIEPNADGDFLVEFQLQPAAVPRANMLGAAAGEIVAVKGRDGVTYSESAFATEGVRPFDEATRKGVIVEGLPAGDFNVEIKGSDGTVRSYPVHLVAGTTTELEVR